MTSLIHRPDRGLSPRERVQRLFSRAKSHLAPDFLAVSQSDGPPVALEATARALLSTLAAPPRPPAVDVSPASPPPLPEALSERELEVLALIAAGLPNRDIADRLNLSLNTIKTHISNIYGKLGVNSRVQAVTRADELGLL